MQSTTLVNLSPLEIRPLISACQTAWKWSLRLLNKHTDLVSSIGILTITTCLLAAKIFRNISPLLPRLALVVYNFSGIIWINVQIRDLLKSWQDLKRAVVRFEASACIETAVKVFVKGTNVLLTCSAFTASILAVSGYPQLMAFIYLNMRPFSVLSLGLNILTDFSDYFKNENLLKQLDAVELETQASQKVSKVMVCFLEIIRTTKRSSITLSWPNENRFAHALVRQLDEPTITTFCDSLKKRLPGEHVRVEAMKLFYHLKDSMISKQAGIKANLSLIMLGYLAMALSRSFPDTVIDMASRWSMSVLYTDELIRQKLFQADLETHLQDNCI